MEIDEDLKQNILDAIRWDPSFNEDEIKIAVQDGIVTLTGSVDNYAKKASAETVAKNVTGVIAVVENIEVSGNRIKDNDIEIAGAIASAFKGHYEIPKNCINVKVESGWVTLDGNVEWNHQREAAKKIVSDFIGVKGVLNNIIIKPISTDAVEKKSVEEALARSGFINDTNIIVEVNGNAITLTGTTDTLYEKGQAERVAWQVPGVTNVSNELEVFSVRDNT